MDITGDGAIEFFLNRINMKIKWPTPSVPECTIELGQISGGRVAIV